VERASITLDPEHAEKLARLAERMHVQPGAVAQSLLIGVDGCRPVARVDQQ
jgi:hypothetical protein